MDHIRQKRALRLVTDLLPPLVFPESRPLRVETHLVRGEPIPVTEALVADYTPFAVGQPWGGAWSTAWFHLTGNVPRAWSGREVVARVHLGYNDMPGVGGEGLVYDGTTPLQGINSRHSFVRIAGAAIGGESVDLHVEAAANPQAPWGGLEWPSLLPDYEGTPLYRLERAELAVRDVELEAAWRDLQVLSDLASSLGLAHPRSVEIFVVMEQVALAIDYDDIRQSLLSVRPLWAPLLAAGPPADELSSALRHRVTAVGHAHIDSAWLWPVRETRRKCARTFSTALRLMEIDDDFVFVCSQAAQHAFVEEDHPSLFAQMRERAAAGRFEPVGSMWVEPDTNLPSGESLVRQLVYGKRYFLDRYGIETTDCWLPDAFGYSGNLPQILRSAGVRHFLTQKLSWNDIDRFPHHSFWWEGIDGSTVLAHCPPTDTYNGEFQAAQLLKGQRDFAQYGVSRRSLYAFGYGDGGGGPTEEMLARFRRLRRLEEFAGIELGTAAGFFRELEKDALDSKAALDAARPGTVETEHAAGGGGLPTWVGELYLERHRAVQTTQAALKRANRRCEALLRELELWSLAAPGAGPRQAELEALWKTLLLHQFHDILPGSSIRWVNEQATEALAGLERRLEELIAGASVSIARAVEGPGNLVCLNAASRPRREVCEVALAEIGIEGALAVSPAGGAAAPIQLLGEGRALVVASAPGCGWSLLETASEPIGAWGEAVSVLADGDDLVLANGLVTVRVDANGELPSLFDHSCGREVIAPRRRGNVLQLHDDLPNDADAWDVDPGTFARARELTSAVRVEVSEAGPLRASVVVERRFGRSLIVQQIRLAAGSRRVEVLCDVDWQERHKFLKVAFPVAVRAQSASYEIPFGHLQRPTHANTTWDTARFEVPAQRWADLSEPGFGVALLNDCKYGYDVRANVMRLSLLRAPSWPDPEVDRGRHRFSYAVMAHGGLAADVAAVIDQAESFNLPLRVVARPPSQEPLLPGTSSVVEIEGAAVSAVKQADAGAGIVVRFYEARGAHGRARLRLPLAAITGVRRCDALERVLEGGEPLQIDDGGLINLELRPFELVSLSLQTVGRT